MGRSVIRSRPYCQLGYFRGSGLFHVWRPRRNLCHYFGNVLLRTNRIAGIYSLYRILGSSRGFVFFCLAMGERIYPYYWNMADHLDSCTLYHWGNDQYLFDDPEISRILKQELLKIGNSFLC